MKALEDAVQMAERVTELTSLRDELGARVVGAGRGRAGAPRDRRRRRPRAIEAPAGSGDGMYAGQVEVEVGPLSDFAQLTGLRGRGGGHPTARPRSR